MSKITFSIQNPIFLRLRRVRGFGSLRRGGGRDDARVRAAERVTAPRGGPVPLPQRAKARRPSPSIRDSELHFHRVVGNGSRAKRLSRARTRAAQVRSDCRDTVETLETRDTLESTDRTSLSSGPQVPAVAVAEWHPSPSRNPLKIPLDFESGVRSPRRCLERIRAVCVWDLRAASDVQIGFRKRPKTHEPFSRVSITRAWSKLPSRRDAHRHFHTRS